MALASESTQPSPKVLSVGGGASAVLHLFFPTPFFLTWVELFKSVGDIELGGIEAPGDRRRSLEVSTGSENSVHKCH